MAINMIKIRARITIGGLEAVTPPLNPTGNHIQSFNVDKVRGQNASFSASLKVKHLEVSGDIIGSSIKIQAGKDNPSNTIFSGIVKSVTISPCREDPAYVLMNINGTDIMSRLDGKKYTRRCRSTRGLWVGIEGVARQGLRSGKLVYVPEEPTIEPWGGDVTRKDNVVRTRGINKPENIPAAPKGSEGVEPTISVENVEAQ